MSDIPTLNTQAIAKDKAASFLLKVLTICGTSNSKKAKTRQIKDHLNAFMTSPAATEVNGRCLDAASTISVYWERNYTDAVFVEEAGKIAATALHEAFPASEKDSKRLHLISLMRARHDARKEDEVLLKFVKDITGPHHAKFLHHVTNDIDNLVKAQIHASVRTITLQWLEDATLSDSLVAEQVRVRFHETTRLNYLSGNPGVAAVVYRERIRAWSDMLDMIAYLETK